MRAIITNLNPSSVSPPKWDRPHSLCFMNSSPRPPSVKSNGSLSNNYLLLVKTGQIKPDLDLFKIL